MDWQSPDGLTGLIVRQKPPSITLLLSQKVSHGIQGFGANMVFHAFAVNFGGSFIDTDCHQKFEYNLMPLTNPRGKFGSFGG